MMVGMLSMHSMAALPDLNTGLLMTFFKIGGNVPVLSNDGWILAAKNGDNVRAYRVKKQHG